MIWTAARGHEKCGLCDHAFTPDEPLAILGSKFKRCAPCVSGTPVDWDAVHAEIEARRAIQTGEDVPNIRQSFDRVVPGSLNEALKNFGIKGVKRSRQPEPRGPKPFSEVADDPAVARAGDDK